MMAKWDTEAKMKYNTYAPNKWAMKILNKLKYGARYGTRKYQYPALIKGPVILYDDNGDMSTEKWNTIKKFMRGTKEK